MCRRDDYPPYEPDEWEAKCPACGEFISYCQGHGEIGDPYGHEILMAHDDGDHTSCHPDGCDELKEMVRCSRCGAVYDRSDDARHDCYARPV